MKKFLASTGLLASMTASIGVLFKILHWPGANIVLTGGIVLFCLLFLPLWVYQKFTSHPQQKADKSMWSAVLTAGVFVATGSIFEILQWPGAGLMIIVSGLVFAFGFLPMLFFKMYGNKQFG